MLFSGDETFDVIGIAMGRMTFVLGGARSGKSRFAVEFFDRSKRIAYIATAVASDDEMKARIQEHKEMRPARWTTIESPADVASAVEKVAGKCEGVIIDCLTLLVSNLLLDEENPANKQGYIMGEVEKLCKVCKAAPVDVVIVSNEVGEGVVPDTKLGRDFRDIHGIVNQYVARECDEVYFLIAGIPQRLK